MVMLVSNTDWWWEDMERSLAVSHARKVSEALAHKSLLKLVVDLQPEPSTWLILRCLRDL